jgi:uncharacterized membrane protein
MNPSVSSVYFYAAAAGLAGIASLHLWTSRINRFFFFSRTVPGDFTQTPAALAVTRRYITRVLIGLLLSLATLVTLSWQGRSLYISFLSALLVELLVSCISYGVAHREAGLAQHALPESLASTQTVATQDQSISVLLIAAHAERPLLGILLPVLLAAAIWCIAVLVSGQGWTRFSDAAGRLGGAVMLGMATGMLVAGTVFLLLLRYSSRHHTPMARYIGRIMTSLTWFATAMVAGLALAGLRHRPVTRDAVHAFMSFVVGLLAVHFFNAWSRSRQFTPPAAEQNGDDFWRWGLFYYNSGDPALFVQSRSAPGYTLNFGNVYAWPISALIVCNFLFLALSRHRW